MGGGVGAGIFWDVQPNAARLRRILVDIASVASVTRGPAWVPSFYWRSRNGAWKLLSAARPRRGRRDDASFEHFADAALQSRRAERLLEEADAGADVGLLQRLFGVSRDV